ncbi:MAG: hypothetical protein Kow0029_10390 [Candidatus Rifleibacteriota bacterium]
MITLLLQLPFKADANTNLQSAIADLSPVPFILLGLVVLVTFIGTSCRGNNLNGQKEIDDNYVLEHAINLIRYSQLATAAIDVNMKVIFCNKSFASFMQKKPDEIIGQNVLNNMPFAKNYILYSTLEKIYQERKIPAKPIVLLMNKYGNKPEDSIQIDLVATIRPYGMEKPDLMMLVLASSDKTDLEIDDLLKSLQQKDSELKKMEEIDKLKSEFLATLSHELKTPLVSIKGYLDLMASEKFGPLTEGQKKALRVSLKNTSNLNSLISSILNFARMEAGKLKFDLNPQKISSLILDTIDSMKPIADKNEIEISADISPDLPWVIMDSELIHRVLSNLLDNAIKFSKAKSRVVVKANIESDDLIRVSVIDFGEGIPADKIEKIKAPFYQADNTDTRPRGGLGLGLAICEKILAGHGTSLLIQSEPGKGSCVSFTLKTSQPRKAPEILPQRTNF